MTLLGRRNPLRRFGFAVRGWLHPPEEAASAKPPIFVAGHRGAALFAAENTIAAFEKAIELGADAVEADICVTKDGRFVVWHDADPNSKAALVRQAGGEGLLYNPDAPDIGSRFRKPVAELLEADLLKHYGYTLNEGGPKSALSGDPRPRVAIATMEDLFAWALAEPRLRHLLLDVKLTDGQEKAGLDLLAAARQVVPAGGFRDDLVLRLLLPHRDVAKTLFENARQAPLPPAIALHADFELPGVLPIARRLSARNVSMGWRRRIWAGYRRELADVVAARERGDLDSVVAWTLNEEKSLREIATQGVDGILTDDPALLRRIVG